MCGIAGLIWSKSRSDNVLHNILRSLYHRGPDEAGIYSDDFIGLVHSRLSIIDLDNGRQPFVAEGRDEILVYNGEIYNYQELREELKGRGVELLTDSDTELLYHLILLDGEAALDKLNGQFALCFYQPRSQSILLARDHLGEKPLYYCSGSSDFVFASEVKAICAALGRVPEFDMDQLNSIVHFWSPTPDASVFEGVKQLAPGNVLILCDGEVRIRPFTRYEFKKKLDVPSSEDVLALLSAATKRRLASDVPVGLMLSGGLDSSIVGREIRRHRPNSNLKTFSIGFANADYDEKYYQELMVKQLESEHHYVCVDDDDIVENLEDALWFAESPSPRFAFVAMYILHKKIREAGIKVVLTGEGADEVFLGYDIFRESLFRARIRAGASFEDLRGGIENINTFMKNDSKYNELLALKYANYKSLSDNTEWNSSHDQRLNMAATARKLLSGNQLMKASVDLWHKALQKKYCDFTAMQELDVARVIEIETLLTGHLLSVQGDRMSMASGVETRPPFLDRDLVAAILCVDSVGLLTVGDAEKALLKNSYRTQLPVEVVDRTKFPFRAPDSLSFKLSRLGRKFVETLLLQELPESSFDEGRTRKFIDRFYSSGGVSPRQNHAFVLLISSLTLRRVFRKRALLGGREYLLRLRARTKFGVVSEVLDWAA